MAGKPNPATLLFDIPPAQIETFCNIVDTGVGSLGWRGLAARISPSWLDMRCMEMRCTTGKSPTQELLWSWAQQNKTLGDLLQVLEDMGHWKALSLFQCPIAQISPGSPRSLPMPPPPPLSGEVQRLESPRHIEQNTPCMPCSSSPADVRGDQDGLVMSFQDVIEGTGNFHSDNRMGSDDFSEVYRGMHGSDTFAVKVLKQVQSMSQRELLERFLKEIEVLHLYKHPNILQLRGHFSNGDRYFLVYPFLPNGSLYNRLHTQDPAQVLSWQERLNIIKGTARAIHHLHTTHPCAVISGNIHSANILLDECLQPKLTDFTMAHLRPLSINQNGTITMVTSVHNNFGHLPEEYIRDAKLSVKVDVYSYGVVLLETTTGLEVIQEKPNRKLLRATLEELAEKGGGVDSCLALLDSRVDCWPYPVALSLLRLGMECSASKARNRPTMETVLKTLCQLLPLPCPPEDQPHTLEDCGVPSSTSHCPQDLHQPVEDEDMSKPPNCLRGPQPVSQSDLPSLSLSPCECSQSEITFLTYEDGINSQRSPKQPVTGQSSPQTDDGPIFTSVRQPQCESLHRLQLDCAAESVLDMYSSWPVECSCTEADSQECEDCLGNTNTTSQPG